MYDDKRGLLCHNYNRAKNYFVSNPQFLIDAEHYVTDIVNRTILDNLDELQHDYNEASYLNPYWANYPPEDRGRAPVGDQIPWIEVGEHSVGHKLNRLLAYYYRIAEIGLPSGADNRFTLESDELLDITNGFTNKVFVFLDIKSVGPRDNFDHTVISPYQVSGDGIWDKPEDDLSNSSMRAVGARAQHIFYPAISPIYALTDGSIAPTIHLFVKPVYGMLSMSDSRGGGQPLECIKNICVPNGLLLSVNPNYLDQYPGLFFPGKDDKKKDPKKIRVRVSFEILRNIAAWRVTDFNL